MSLESIPATYEQLARVIDHYRKNSPEVYWSLNPAYSDQEYWCVMSGATIMGYYATAESDSYLFPDKSGVLHKYGPGTSVSGLIKTSAHRGLLEHVVNAVPGPLWGEAFDQPGLSRAFVRHGFKRARWLTFNEDVAPNLWREGYGTPDYVLWKLERD